MTMLPCALLAELAAASRKAGLADSAIVQGASCDGAFFFLRLIAYFCASFCMAYWLVSLEGGFRFVVYCLGYAGRL